MAELTAAEVKELFTSVSFDGELSSQEVEGIFNLIEQQAQEIAAANARIAELEYKLMAQTETALQEIARREQAEAQNKRMREALERIAACLNQSEHNAMIALQIAEQWEQMGEKHEEK